MKDPVKDSERNFKILLAVIGIGLAVVGLAVLIFDYMLEQRAINVTARVVSVNYEDGKSKATVSFRLTGHEYETDIVMRNNNTYAVDDKINVKVDMYDPKKEIINNHFYIYIPLLLAGIVLMFMSIPYLVKYFKNIKRHIELKKNGFYINATITEVFLNNNEKVKRHGAYPYKLRAKYFNPQTQTEYVFESEDTYVNLNDPIGEYQKTTVAVYLDQSDLKNYYVDLESLYPALNVVDPIAIMGPKTEIKFHFGTKKQKEWEEEQKKLNENADGLHSTDIENEEQSHEENEI